jgi:XRE family transcriptional regulator, regulator of sulfur utilization
MSDRPPRSLDQVLSEEARCERRDALLGPDSPEGRELARAVGANVVRVRQQRGLDLGALAVRSGVPLERLSAFEAGQAVPTLRAIWHLATALEVPFGELLRDTLFSSAMAGDFRVQRADRGRMLASASGRFRSRVLFLEGDARSPEVYELTLAPGCREQAEPHAPGTYEHLVVVRGSIVVRAGDDQTRLDAGDAIFFRADRPHGYENHTDAPAVAHLVMSYASR